jgi:hypothetical protein
MKNQLFKAQGGEYMYTPVTNAAAQISLAIL